MIGEAQRATPVEYAHDNLIETGVDEVLHNLTDDGIRKTPTGFM